MSLVLAASYAAAQNTTISGTVYDPRTTASSLPLPNVLVYVTTAPVAAPPSGVQCLTSTNSTPSGVVSYTYTAVDGTFTLGNVPVNASYTVVIQAGKWQRQFSETVGAGPLTGLALHMPGDHTQGTIPRIAISTGAVDALECVLLDMGIAQTEFSDDNSDPNNVLPIHLYQGTGTSSGGASGAEITASTPVQSALMSNLAKMNIYDMVMFPCQGSAFNQSPAAQTNLLNFANAGGRIFATHYSFVWLDPAAPFDSDFPAVANWTTTAEQQVANGVGTVNTNFSDGATLAQWLQNSGATVTGTANQIAISTLRTDVGSVIPPSQSWVTLNSGSYPTQSGNPVMQMTFNTPVNAAAASQCGRVMYNDYHVKNSTATTGMQFPAECPALGAAGMSTQEEMLEYALFDLSSFVTPVVVPTLTIGFTPSPLIVKAGDTGDQVTVNVTNTSATTQIYSSVVLTLTLPTGLTATALTDASGGWVCTVGTLTCTRNTSLAANTSDAVTLTVSVGQYGPSVTSGVITATVASPNFSNNVSNTDNVIYQQPPTITWPTPANIVYGTALSGTQLDATASVAGSFSYSPMAGTLLSVGAHTLMATFTPTDATHYTSATASVMLTVLPISPGMGLTANNNPVFQANGVTFTATIQSTSTPPTGTVTFYDGGTQIGTGTVSGSSASFTTTTLSIASHSIVALYGGDSNYGPATSGILTENVEDFTLVAGGSGTVSVKAGGLATYSLAVTPVGGTTFPSGISLNLTGTPLGATSGFSQTTVAAGAGATTVTLQMQLPNNALLEPAGRPFGGVPLPLALSLVLLPFAGRLRRAGRQWRRLAVLALIGVALAVGITGCGSNGKLNSSSYTLTVTGVSGGLSHSTTMQLTVQ